VIIEIRDDKVPWLTQRKTSSCLVGHLYVYQPRVARVGVSRSNCARDIATEFMNPIPRIYRTAENLADETTLC
jgi:hypothetical protein